MNVKQAHDAVINYVSAVHYFVAVLRYISVMDGCIQLIHRINHSETGHTWTPYYRLVSAHGGIGVHV